jgi:hypothetical protein
MEADRRADVEITVILSRFPLEIVVCENKEKGSEEGYSSIGESLSDVNLIISFKTSLQRVMDDDRLSNSCWNSEREVELWENERFGGEFLFFSVYQFPYNQSSQAQILLLILHPRLVKTLPSQLQPPRLLFHSLSRFPLLHCRLLLNGWSKQNQKNGERN